MCFDSTHATAATAARAAGTGLVSMSTRPDIPGMLHLEREARDWSTYNEYSYRIILLLLPYVYCSRAHPHLFPFSISEASPAGFFLPLAQTHQNPGGKAIYFFMRKASTFFKTYFGKHYYRRKNTTIFWLYRFRQSRDRRKMRNRLPPKNYRRIALPPQKYRHILVYRFRQSHYRQKRENRQPPKKYRRIAIPPRLCPTKKPLLMTTLHK